MKKKALAILLALSLTVTMAPMQTFATGDDFHVYDEGSIIEEHIHTEDCDHEGEEDLSELIPYEDIVISEDLVVDDSGIPDAENPPTLLDEVQSDMDAILEKFSIEVGMTEEEIGYVIQTSNYPNNPMDDYTALEAKASGLTEAELIQLETYESTETFVRFYSVLDQMMNPMVIASSGTYGTDKGLPSGIEVKVSGATDTSASNGTVTVTAKGSGGFWGFLASSKTATITITNTLSTSATLSFNWTATSINELKIDGTKYTGASGSFSKLLNNKNSFTITITTAKNDTTNKLVMNNFSIVKAAESSSVTVNFAPLGSVTAAGNSITNGQIISDVTADTGITLVATPVSGATFLGWIDTDTKKLYSTSTNYTLKPEKDLTIQAVFTNNTSAPWLLVNSTSLYDDFNEAMTAASTAGNKTVVVMNDSILPAGDYTIPAGVTLLVPYDAANTLHTTKPGAIEDNYETPFVYRTLNLASGANIVVNGAISLSARQGTKQQFNGAPSGALSVLNMYEGSKITVNNEANLYAWGYIAGKGKIVAKDGSKVYESFQVMDWRGGSATSDMLDKDEHVFPFSQYYVQNIQVPLTLEKGSVEYGHTSVSITLMGLQSSSIPFIGGEGLFRWGEGNGSITKDYDETTDRLILDVQGNAKMASISMSMNLGILIGNKIITSSNYTLPITNNITVNIQQDGNVAINQDIALLPGAIINVEEGGSCTSDNNVFIYDTDSYEAIGGEGFSSTGRGNFKIMPVHYIIGEKFIRTDEGLTDATIKVNGTLTANGHVFTTTGGANIYSTKKGKIYLRTSTEKDLVTYQALQGTGEHNSDITFVEIPITAPILKNGNNAHPAIPTTTGTYIYNQDKKRWECTHTSVLLDKYKDENGNLPENNLDVYLDNFETSPDCTRNGIALFCTESSCGCFSYNERITIPDSALGHTYSPTVTKPTCTNPGYTTYTCTRCKTDSYIDDERAATGHTPVTDAAKAPTCTATGLTEGSHCSTCGTVLDEQETVAALGHTAVTDAAKAPTCTATGLTEGSHCSTCGTVLDEQETVAALGHTAVTDAAKAPTCTATGLTEGSHCDICGTVLISQEILGAKGHSFAGSTIVKDNEDGTHSYLCLNDCGTYGNPADHTWSEWQETLAPTETVEGSEQRVCTACNSEDTQVVPALGHLCRLHTVLVEAKEPSCTESGNIAHYACKDGSGACGKLYSDKEATDLLRTEDASIKARGHNWNSGMVTTDPKCLTEGVKTFTCLVADCEATYTEPINPLGHKFEGEIKSNGNSKESSHSYLCVNGCGTYGGTVDHTWSEEEDACAITTTATCIAPGVKTYTCTTAGCDGSYTIPIPVLEHSYTGDIQNDANGTTHSFKCVNGCELFGSASEHIWNDGEVTTPATCIATGVKTYTCTTTGCNGSYTQPIDLIAHTFGTVVPAKDTSCKEAGNTEYKQCESCNHYFPADASEFATDGEETNVFIIKALAHSPKTIAGKPATCEVTGLTDGIQCTVCETMIAEQEIIPMIPHLLKYATAKPPTFTEPGTNAYEFCTECGYNTLEAVPALGEPAITNYDEFLDNLVLLEQLAVMYAEENPGKDPLLLLIKYIRTGVERYNSGSWGIMAGYEDKDFATYVRDMENEVNIQIADVDNYIKVTGLKNLVDFTLPNGNTVDFGHMFGTMDISYHNKGSIDHADVSGWAGDLVDLVTAADLAYSKSEDSTLHLDIPEDLEDMIDQVEEQIFLHTTCPDNKFALTDYYGDIDGYYVVEELYKKDYEAGDLTDIIREYCTEDLDDVDRAAWFLKTRLDNPGTRDQVRNAVYDAYTANRTITTLESTRDFLNTDASYIEKLRRASCYAFADYLCKLAGDYVEVADNPYYTDFYSELTQLAPGVTQDIRKATTADGKQIVYYLGTADLSNPYVDVYANYNENDPTSWKMSRVLDQANAAQNKYGDPESPWYIPNYQVVVSTNADGFNMSTGQPSGLLVMNGTEWHPVNNSGFFGITKEGKAVIGSKDDYNNTYKGQLRDGVAGFGTLLVKDGKVNITATSDYYSDRASRTAVGITKTGRVVLMVLDGRQEPVSAGGSMVEIAQIMMEAGCWTAINLDGGGSTTFVSKPEGSDELQVTSKPSDGYARSVSSTLMIVSTAPSSTAFDHAKIESAYDYATIGTPVTMTASGVSATGNVAELPEGCAWAVSDDTVATITADGTLTGIANGDVEVYLMQEDKVVGEKTMYIVVPTALYFTRESMPAVYESTITLPVAALYAGKPVAINTNDVNMLPDPLTAGTCGKNTENNAFTFTAAAETNGIKVVKINASLATNSKIGGSMTINLFRQGENTFDFDKAIGGDKVLAWTREVTNSVTEDNSTYNAIDTSKDMVTSYIFAMDMSQITIPERLSSLVYMLPGADDVDASAWNFLLQLAERISVLTEVTPVLKFDSRFDVDVTNLKVMNEYFPMESYEFDEATNTLTIHMRWKDQTAAIDVATANPLCLVTGIKLTPKAGSFDNTERLAVVNKGTIGYKIYLRANALYSFSQKPENQEIFALYPFTNTFIDANGEEKYEAGGYFESIYAEIEDTYTLSHAKLNGWINEGSGNYAYYVNGEKLKGIQKLGGYYYDFGTNGLNAGQTKYTGIFNEGGNHYAKNGEIVTSGWHTVGDKTWHCHEDGFAYTVKVTGQASCIKATRPTYTCDQCRKSEVQPWVMPNGHTWDENHKCLVCGFMGISIDGATFGYGTLKNPYNGTNPTYYFNAGGVRPAIFGTFDGRKELEWSADSRLKDDGSMMDLIVSWPNSDGIGKAYIEINGKGNYYGTKILPYTIIPRDVTNLKATNITLNSYTLTWDKAGGADYYGLFETTDGTYKLVTSTYTNKYDLADMEPGTARKFVVAAYAFSTDGENKTYACAKWSNELTATTLTEEQPPVDPDGPDQPGGEGPDGPDNPSGEGGGNEGGENPPAGGDEGGNNPPSGPSGTTAPPSGGGEYIPVVKPDPIPEVEFDVTNCTGGEECVAKHFDDVTADNWFHHAVDYVYIRGIMNGVSDTSFNPNGTTTRAMVWTMLARLRGIDTSKGETWWEVGQKWAMETGVSDGTDPHGEITREQLATMLWRYTGEERSSHDLSAFPDDHQISSWALGAMKWANENKIINGNADGTLKPGNDATRAQVAQMFMNFMEQQ